MLNGAKRQSLKCMVKSLRVVLFDPPSTDCSYFKAEKRMKHTSPEL